MGKTNRLGHLSPRRELWPDTLLPFLDWFIRHEGFEIWWGGLTGTPEEREEHPFPWAYDEVTESLRYEDRWIEDGRVVEQEVMTTLPLALEELLGHQVDLALSVIRTRASHSDREDSLLIPYLSEVEALTELSDAHPTLSLHPTVRAALEKLQGGVRLLGSPKLKKPKSTKRGGGIHQQNEGWIVQAYAAQRAKLPGQSKYDARQDVAEQYKEQFGLSINESSIRNALGER